MEKILTVQVTLQELNPETLVGKYPATIQELTERRPNCLVLLLCRTKIQFSSLHVVVNHTSKIPKLISSHHIQNKSMGSQHAVFRDLSTQGKKAKENMQMCIFIAMDMHGKPESFLFSFLLL